MEKLTENHIKSALFKVLNEETSKVKRDEFARLQFKIEELQNSLNETLKELRKVEDCVPSGLKTLCNNRVNGISENLNSAQKLTSQLKDKIRKYRKSLYTQQEIEKKK
jgi:chromosome segregation ATPase